MAVRIVYLHFWISSQNKIRNGSLKELMKTGSKGILLYKLFKSLYPVSSDENFEGYATFLI